MGTVPSSKPFPLPATAQHQGGSPGRGVEVGRAGLCLRSHESEWALHTKKLSGGETRGGGGVGGRVSLGREDWVWPLGVALEEDRTVGSRSLLLSPTHLYARAFETLIVNPIASLQMWALPEGGSGGEVLFGTKSRNICFGFGGRHNNEHFITFWGGCWRWWWVGGAYISRLLCR